MEHDAVLLLRPPEVEDAVEATQGHIATPDGRRIIVTPAAGAPVEFSLDGDGPLPLLPGMFVEVRLMLGRSTTSTLLPASAVWEDPLTGDWTVFVVEETDGLHEPAAQGGEIPEARRRVVRRSVEVLAEGRGRVGVRGVDEGEWVVTLGQHLLQESLEAANRQLHDAMTELSMLYRFGRELSNAFSELNDPIDQRQRFEAFHRVARRAPRIIEHRLQGVRPGPRPRMMPPAC